MGREDFVTTREDKLGTGQSSTSDRWNGIPHRHLLLTRVQTRSSAFHRRPSPRSWAAVDRGGGPTIPWSRCPSLCHDEASPSGDGPLSARLSCAELSSLQHGGHAGGRQGPPNHRGRDEEQPWACRSLGCPCTSLALLWHVHLV